MHISIADKTHPVVEGIFTLRVLDRSGAVVYSFEDHNQIVNPARVALARLVGDGDQSKMITKFGVGAGATTAVPTDTDLTDKYVNALLGHEYPEPGMVRFSWRLEYGEANGKSVTEFGLFCEDGSLFARKVRGAIYKDADLAFEGEWSIIF